MTDDFHTYGAMIDEKWAIWYFDGIELWRTKTPEELKTPLYVMVNLAMGSGWPIDKAPSPSYMYVDYVKVTRRTKGIYPPFPGRDCVTGGEVMSSWSSSSARSRFKIAPSSRSTARVPRRRRPQGRTEPRRPKPDSTIPRVRIDQGPRPRRTGDPQGRSGTRREEIDVPQVAAAPMTAADRPEGGRGAPGGAPTGTSTSSAARPAGAPWLRIKEMLPEAASPLVQQGRDALDISRPDGAVPGRRGVRCARFAPLAKRPGRRRPHVRAR
jgi:hypothetical protein